MELIPVNLNVTFKFAFGLSRTGKTVTVTVRDKDGTQRLTGFTLGPVVELGGGEYGVDITFTENFPGYIRGAIGAPDNLQTDIPVVTVVNFVDEIILTRKHTTNRWKIESNQFRVFDDDDVTLLKSFNLFKVGVPNDGTDPDERVPV